MPRLAVPSFAGVDLAAWASANSARLSHELDVFGAILFRGFEVNTPERLQEISERMCGSLCAYAERRSPRTVLAGDVLTSTHFPADQSILFHNEMSFAREWPMRLFFGCLRPADEGGWTPLADSRRVFARIPAATRAAFLERGVRYVRNYHRGVGLSWRETYQTEDVAEVEAICQRSVVGYAWVDGGRLRTWQDRHAIAAHPRTGETVWFNQAHFFHLRSLPDDTAAAIRRNYPEEDLPQQTYFADGSAIADASIDEINAAYAAEAVGFAWERGDLLVLDNMLVAHARTPYRGPRLIAVTLGDLYSPGRVENGRADP
ncbi:TauD/TfdA family dioxygenase [Microvirga calopogonii]|uniref:TauD/TfdA family dioxygenase n=1 Tax=Microvirga calopogonii TaxID=2078013 RepID=UPI0013B46D9F|nr:TauD/TfdA family dioxygenase [Microvirga calopogonii]